MFFMWFERSVVAGLSLLVLSSCSVVARGKVSVPGPPTPKLAVGVASTHGSSSGTVKVAGPQVKAEPDDPPAVEQSVARLAAMEQLLAERKFEQYATESKDFQNYFLFRKGLEGNKKRDPLKARLDALDAAAYASFGGRLVQLVGDGHRVLALADGDAVEAAAAVVNACQSAAGIGSAGGRSRDEVTKDLAAYDKALARAVKMDPNALHYIGPTKSWSIDVPNELLRCEVSLAEMTLQIADEYVAEAVPDTVTEPGCGEIEWVAEAVRIGDGKFAGYTRRAGGTSFVERIACNKIPRRGNAPKAFAEAIASLSERVDLPVRALVIVLDGKPTVEVNQEDLHTYRYQKLRAYSKEYRIAKNPCGEDKLFCEAGGSKGAAAYNRAEFHLERAEAYAGTNPERCKAQLAEVKAKAAWFDEFRGEQIKKGAWNAGATYRTKKGARLDEKAFVAAFADKGKLADDRLTERYCARPAKPAQPAKPAR